MNHLSRCFSFSAKTYPILTAACLLMYGSVAADPWNDDSLGGLTLEELLGDTLTAEELDQRVADAIKQTRRTGDSAAFLEPLDAMIRNPDLWPSHDLAEQFRIALITHGDSERLAERVPRLLKYAENSRHPAAHEKLNLGIVLALHFGGATFEDLRPLTRVQNVDFRWLLPALGKTGGQQALPLIEPHRNDQVVGRLGDALHLNRHIVPDAAILGAAYAGDRDALRRILDNHDLDVLDLPRFAFYVSWGMMHGLDVRASQSMVAYSEHRIRQAERLLDYLGADVLPMLIERANRDGAPAAVGYLIRSMERAPADRLSAYDELLEFPESSLRQRVARRLWSGGDDKVRNLILAHLRERISASAGMDRLYALQVLCELAPAEGLEQLPAAIAREKNPAVRIRLEDLHARLAPDNG